MAKRTCPNCHAGDWPRFRYCEDCWQMVGKTLAVCGPVIGLIAAALGHRLAELVWSFLSSNF